MRVGIGLGIGRRAGGAGGGVSARTITDMEVGTLSDDDLPVTVTSPDATTGDNVWGVMYLDGTTAPNAAEIYAGESTGGGVPVFAFSFAWGDTSVALPDGIALDDYRIAAVIETGSTGVLSNVLSSDAFSLTTVVDVWKYRRIWPPWQRYSQQRLEF